MTEDLVARLRQWAALRPDAVALEYVDFSRTRAGDPVRLTFAELDARARTVADELRRTTAPGDRAALLYPPGVNYVTGLLGCLYAGVQAVPIYPPDPYRSESRLDAVVTDSDPALLLTDSATLDSVRAWQERTPAHAARTALASDLFRSSAHGAQTSYGPAGPGEVAVVQYTSGSTRSPAGVLVTHANLLANARQIQDAFRADETCVFVSWLPLFHDMGLVAMLATPLVLGARAVHMSPLAFVQRPRRWLDAISRYDRVLSAAPDFAYALCVDRIAPEQRAGLDLSGWQVAASGSEPVRASTLERFAEAFAGQGFTPDTFRPSYGMAESTLLISGYQPAGAPPRTLVLDRAELGRGQVLRRDGAAEGPATTRAVSCGAVEGQRVRVVDPDRRAALASGGVGEIWVQGPNVTAGYRGRAELTEETFRAALPGESGHWLRTGDLGFLDEGELFVVGRLKDLVIVDGRNHYPPDIEHTVEHADPGVQPAGTAAFPVTRDDGSEALVVAVELARPVAAKGLEGAERAAFLAALRRAVSTHHAVEADDLVLLRPGTIPRTSSGKIQRRACRAAYLDGTLLKGKK